MVTIFRGVQADLPGVDLSHAYETTNVAGRPALDSYAGTVRRGRHRRRQPRRRRAHRAAASPPTSSPTTDGGAADMAQRTPVRVPSCSSSTAAGAGPSCSCSSSRWSSASAPTPPSASASRARCPPTSSAYGGWLAALIIAAPRRGPARRAVRRPGAAADRGRAQRPRPGGDPPASTSPRADAPDGFARQQLIWMTLGVVLFVAHAGGPARPPRAPALHLHLRPRRDRAAAAADGAGHRHDHQRRPDLDPRSARSASSPARSPRCCW